MVIRPRDGRSVMPARVGIDRPSPQRRHGPGTIIVAPCHLVRRTDATRAPHDAAMSVIASCDTPIQAHAGSVIRVEITQPVAPQFNVEALSAEAEHFSR